MLLGSQIYTYLYMYIQISILNRTFMWQKFYWLLLYTHLHTLRYRVFCIIKLFRINFLYVVAAKKKCITCMYFNFSFRFKPIINIHHDQSIMKFKFFFQGCFTLESLVYITYTATARDIFGCLFTNLHEKVRIKYTCTFFK